MKIRTALAATLAAFTTPAAPVAMTAAPASAQVSSATVIPAPTGPYTVGSSHVEFVDTARTQFLGTGARKFMTQMWYPSNYTGGGVGMKYASAGWLNDNNIGSRIAGGLSDTAMKANITGRYNHASLNGPVWHPTGAPLPLVVIDPGFGMPRITMSALAQELASHGFAVIVFGHSRESIVEEHGSTLQYQQPAPNNNVVDDPYKHLAMSTRLADIDYVMDRLATMPVLGGGHVAPAAPAVIIGHSLGAAAALHYAAAHPSVVDSVVMLDGIASWDLTTGYDTPLGAPTDILSLSTVAGTPGGAGISHPSTQHMLNQGANGNDIWDFRVPGTQHLAFTDIGLLTVGKAAEYRGTITAARISEITRAYVVDFVKSQIGGAENPGILDDNVEDEGFPYPEIEDYSY